MTVISSPVVTAPPPSEVGLPGPEPGPEEASRNVVFLVCVFLPKMLADASRAGLGAESPAPAFSDVVTEAAS